MSTLSEGEHSNPTSPELIQQQDLTTITISNSPSSSSNNHSNHPSISSPLSINGNLPTTLSHEEEEKALVEPEEEEGVELNVEDLTERIKELELELVTTKNEKETFEAQYRSLLGKLTSMRNTLGDKLKQDADELDRREQAITDLRATNEDLLSSLETLRLELIQSNSDSDQLHSELEHLRSRAFDSHKLTAEEATSREISLREAQEDLERVRMEREEWEGEAMRERVRREELVARVSNLEVELGATKGEREILREERDKEAESAGNLLAVLEEFQSAKDRELQTTLGDLELRLSASVEALTEYKRRANLAESRLLEAQNDSEKVYTLTKEVKEKNLLVGKLRHEAVIANEHLTEALRRLKKDSNENSVDRRLVSNVLITFLNTPRADTKRFEMLQLISSILSWTDEQREQVGLQKSSGLNNPGVITGSNSGRSGPAMTRGHSRSGKGKSVTDALGDNETFSTLWIEFLLKEASGNASPTSTDSSLPSTSSTVPLDPLSPNGRRYSIPELSPLHSPDLNAGGGRRPSFTSNLLFSNSNSNPKNSIVAGLTSTPSLKVSPPPPIPSIITESAEEG